MTTDKLTDAEKDALIDAALAAGGHMGGYSNAPDRAIFDAGVKHGMERAAESLTAEAKERERVMDRANALAFAVAAQFIRREIPNV